MEGIYLRTPKAFTKERRIKRNQLGTAILVFGSMWSFSGKGNICFASIGLGPDDEENPKIGKATICSRSGLSKNTVVKYKKLLAQLGWIQVRREGGTKNDTIHLFETPQTILEKVIPNNNDSNAEKIGSLVFNENALGIKNPNCMNEDSCSVPKGVGFTVQNSSKHNINKINNTKHENFQIETKRINSIWTEFLVWAGKRLSKTSYENLKELKIKFENERLYIIGEINDSLKMIVSKYFNEEAKLKTEIKFVKEELQEKEQNFNSSKKSDQKSNQENQTQPNQESSMPVDQSENQDIKTFRDYISVDKVIHEFINHSSLKLNRPELEEIRKLRISYDLEKIVIYDPLPERLKNHIRDYFYSHPQRVIALQFEEGKNKFHVAA
ncbi:helix-turn-helix domain-containing protein [Leptospira interrogans]|uniref:helix-turn-helix domain-containing protein n=3 Tax=Leptospira interrogans TaxID=173 RepID=UPI0007D8B9F5|nr:helix-turn-helix domain-containing protein [Leptospira interrogans]MCR8649455.1 helix-turn-helix domain-containing protein [Leptospira interrogans serovar Bataviae]OAM75455.1 DNA-binding protein [Leptospira interrogans serovar Bataviae]QOI40718.1 helix-turn-helix domain-containing protein [Leptospira interrogans serovar Bataviae]QYY62614.1 helix-turn-helix domain-containing protein [Leptospira interrogans serovar Bataviae]